MLLKEIQNELNTQDNRSTSNPLFIVCDWEKLPTKEDYSSDWEYADLWDGYQAIGTTKDDLIKFAKDNEQEIPEKEMDADELMEWLVKEKGFNLIKNYYFERRVFINAFFTEKAADKFIEENKHHFSKKVHTYVSSLWRNPEMQFIRNNLLEGNFMLKDTKKVLRYEDG